MALSLSAAVNFVQLHASPLEQARLAFLLERIHPSPALIEPIFAEQQSDGGWAPFWARNYSSLDATCYRLAQLEPFGLIPTASAQQALDFLAQRQQTDGSWQENPPGDVVLPAWLDPTEPATTLYLTANCGLWLILHPGAASQCQRSAAYLQAYLHPIEIIALPHIAWLSAALWYACEQREQTEQMLHQLALQYPQLSASALTWAMTSLHLAGIPIDHWFMTRSKEQLGVLQRADGGWSSDDGAERDVHVTLEVIRLMRGMQE
jgi:hypothetical protein